MVDTKQTIVGIIGAIFVMIAGFGGNELISEDQYAHAYVCDVTEDVGFFYGGLSSTEYRAYPLEESTKGYKDCKNADGVKGKWISLEKYAKDKGINPMQFLVGATPEEPIVDPVTSPADVPYGHQVSCVHEGCVPK